MKRKTIDDFLDSTAGRQHPQLQPLKSKDEFNVPGLSLRTDFVTKTEERAILDFLDDEIRCTWRTDLSRRTMHFGGTYCLLPSKQETSNTSKAPRADVIQAPLMPPELSWLIQRFVDEGVFQDEQRPQYCIVNEYIGAQGISAHTENFRFSEPVVGLSLLRACPIRFHEMTKPFDGSVRSGKAARAEKTGRRIDVQMPPRSLLVMRGQSRWRWQHEIVKSEKGRSVGRKRVSLTFRHEGEMRPTRLYQEA